MRVFGSIFRLKNFSFDKVKRSEVAYIFGIKVLFEIIIKNLFEAMNYGYGGAKILVWYKNTLLIWLDPSLTR